MLSTGTDWKRRTTEGQLKISFLMCSGERIKVRYAVESEENNHEGTEDIILETFGEEVVEIIDE